MTNPESALYRAIDALYRDAPVVRLDPGRRIVIMSDFHMSKSDSLKMSIENLCRLYPRSDRKRAIAARVRRYKEELAALEAKRRKDGVDGGLYSSGLTVPSLFNSGCAVGRSGITAIEIGGNEISLVHWFDRRVSRRFFSKNGSSPVRLSGTDYFRKIIKKDNVDYIFARINLLS
jgi:hypothetical protein